MQEVLSRRRHHLHLRSFALVPATSASCGEAFDYAAGTDSGHCAAGGKGFGAGSRVVDARGFGALNLLFADGRGCDGCVAGSHGCCFGCSCAALGFGASAAWTDCAVLASTLRHYGTGSDCRPAL